MVTDLFRIGKKEFGIETADMLPYICHREIEAVTILSGWPNVMKVFWGSNDLSKLRHTYG